MSIIKIELRNTKQLAFRIEGELIKLLLLASLEIVEGSMRSELSNSFLEIKKWFCAGLLRI